MNDLLILGCGVHGGEMAEIVERVNAVRPTWNLLGFVAPMKHAGRVGDQLNGLPILGTSEVLAQYPGASLVPDNEFNDPIEELLACEVGASPEARPSAPRSVARLVSLIDPSAFVSRTAEIGSGCVIYPNCFIGLNARLGRRIFVLSGSVINHDDRLEDRVTLCSHVTLAGFVHVEPDCYLGQACAVRQYLRIGQGSLIGMASVVLRDVPPDSVMVGNPARRLRSRSENSPPPPTEKPS